MTNEPLSNGIKEYEEYFREFDSWLQQSEESAVKGWRESAAILLALGWESRERERTLREKYNYDPTQGCLVRADAEPRIKDVDTERSFSLAVVGWMNFDGAVKISQRVLMNKELETTAENRLKLAALSALAWLGGYHALLVWLLSSPFEKTKSAAVVAISGRTATRFNRQFVRDVLKREDEDLYDQLPPAVLDALGGGNGFHEMGREVIMAAMKSVLDGQSLTDGDDAVSAEVRAAVDRDLRERDRAFRQRGRKTRKEVSLPKTAGEDFQLREHACRLQVSEELRSFVEKARMLLTGGEMRVLQLQVENPALTNRDIAKVLGITSATVSMHQANFRKTLEQTGLKEGLIQNLGQI